MSTFYTTGLRLVFLSAVVISALASLRPVRADEPFEISVEIKEITPPEACDATGWAISLVRETAITGARPNPDLGRYPSSVMRYVIQYVDDELNLVHYWGSGYSAYVQDYMVWPQTENFAQIKGRYPVPLWSDTYRAVTVEYLLYEDRIVWETRAALDCDAGEVAAYKVETRAADGVRADLPEPGRNLVLALQDIRRYRNPFNNTGYLGTIKACQTFFVSEITMPRASISTYARESITGQAMLIAGAPTPVPIVDVHEDYGQPGGQPILDDCAVK